MKFRKMAYPYNIWMVIFIVVPLLMVLYYAFSANSQSFSLMDLTLDNFKRFFFDENYLGILLKSLRMAVVATALCMVIGYPVAYFLSRMSLKAQTTLLMMVVIPMWMNFLLRTYAWVAIISKNGLLNNLLAVFGIGPFNMIYTEGAVLLGMVYNFLPFMILPIYSVLVKIDKDVIEAAEDLGANKLEVFQKVVFPMSLPGVIAGVFMVVIPAISTFEISSLLGGNKHNLIGNVIEQQFTVTGNWSFGSAMSMVLMFLILLTILIQPEESSESGGGLF